MDPIAATQNKTTCFKCQQIRFYFESGVISADERRVMLQKHRKEVELSELDETMAGFSFVTKPE